MSHSTGGESASSPCTAPASALRTQTQPDNRSALTNSAGRIQRLLLAPFHAGRLALRNRIVFSAHTTNYARDGKPSARHVAYHRARARGGVGLIISEGVRVHPTSLGRDNTISGFDDDLIDPLTTLIDAVHAEGAAFAVQLLHIGRQSGSHLNLTPPWGPSEIPWSPTGRRPHAMSLREIAELVESFAATARRAVAAGADAVEVHLGHGHLLQQFLSPASNRRQDRYGGSLDNRMRLSHEVLHAVRTAVGPHFPIIVRISAEEFIPGGLGLDDMLEVVAKLREIHDFDLLHVSHAAYASGYTLATQMADMTFESGQFRHLPAAFKREFPDLPVLAVCRIDSLDLAAELVESKAADLVAMTRAHIADPDIISKYQAGRAHTIRSCIACNEGCVGRLELGLPITCVVNPEAGLEKEWRQLRRSSRQAGRKRILVVGGGPAGLAAALAAAEAGRDVTIVEREQELGGAVRLAARMHRRHRLALLVTEQVQALTAAGVTIRLGHHVVADEVLAGDWDGVIIAVGASDGAPHELTGHRTYSPHEVLSGTPLGRVVVVVDEDGSWRGAGLAAHLAHAGHTVELVSPHGVAGWRITMYSRPSLIQLLTEGRVVVHVNRIATAWSGSELTIADPISGREEQIPCDDVVYVRPRVARTELQLKLEESQLADRVVTVGDAYAPRGLLEAAFEGRFAGLTVAAGDTVAAAAQSLRGRL